MEVEGDHGVEAQEPSTWELLRLEMPIDVRTLRGVCASLTLVYAGLWAMHGEMGDARWPALIVVPYALAGAVLPAPAMRKHAAMYLNGMALLIAWGAAYGNSIAQQGLVGITYSAVTLFIGTTLVLGKHVAWMAPLLMLGQWLLGAPADPDEAQIAATVWLSVWVLGTLMTMGQAVQRARVMLAQRRVAAERDRAEAATKRAEEADRAKSEFLAQVSHELRTPLNGVLGVAEVLRQRTTDADSLRLVRTMRNSARALRTMLNDLLDASKIEAGCIELEHAPFDPRGLTMGVVDLFEADCKQHGLELVGQVDEEVPAMVVGDAARVQQVLCNLVSNAIKFTEQGSITIHLRAMPFGAGRAGLEWSVEDTGIGIEPERKDAIFQAFAQADTSITRRFGGTGLGLHISANLLTQMGGLIEVESEPGRGSTFTVSLDMELAPAEATSSSPSVYPAAAAPGRALRVLVADDAEVNLIVAEATLKALGHEPVIVASGAEALSHLAEQSFDLLVVDLEMPDMDGYATVRNMRAHNDQSVRSVPVIALSGHTSEETRERSRQAGVDSYLAKPYAPEELAQAIEEALERVS